MVLSGSVRSVPKMAVAPRHKAGPVAARTRHDQTARTVHGVSVPSPPVTFHGLGPFVTATVRCLPLLGALHLIRRDFARK